MEYFFTKSFIEFTNVGFTREEAYKIVQKNAMKSLEGKFFIFK